MRNLNELMSAERRLMAPIELVELDPENANDHDDVSIEAIRASYEKFGQQKPIVVRVVGEAENPRLRCVAGSGQRAAAGLLGWPEIWVVITDLDELSATAYGIADNATAGHSKLNDQRLANLLKRLDDAKFPTEFVGIEHAKLKDLISRANVAQATAEPNEKVREQRVEVADDQNGRAAGLLDQAKEFVKKWHVEPGQIWEIPSMTAEGDSHRVVCGDSRDWKLVKRLFNHRKADAVVTDSPYGINRDGISNDDPKGLRDLFDAVIAEMPIENGVIVNFQSPNLKLSVEWLDAIRARAGHRLERLLWMYKANDCTFPWRGWIMTGEVIIVSSVGEAHWNEVEPFSHDTYTLTNAGGHLPKEWGKVHASVKDLATVADLVSRVTKPRQIVYDPFAGSGTTVHAAEISGRVCYAIDDKIEHVAVLLERMNVLAGLKPRKYEAPRLVKQ